VNKIYFKKILAKKLKYKNSCKILNKIILTFQYNQMEDSIKKSIMINKKTIKMKRKMNKRKLKKIINTIRKKSNNKMRKKMNNNLKQMIKLKMTNKICLNYKINN